VNTQRYAFLTKPITPHIESLSDLSVGVPASMMWSQQGL